MLVLYPAVMWVYLLNIRDCVIYNLPSHLTIVAAPPLSLSCSLWRSMLFMVAVAVVMKGSADVSRAILLILSTAENMVDGEIFWGVGVGCRKAERPWLVRL